jgi:septum formation topological specificity factor MinE
MDREFEKVKDELLDVITTYICSKNEHNPEIEWKIRHTKERCKCIKADIPVKVLPSVVVKHMVINAVMFINAFVDEQGISSEPSPSEIILGWNLTPIKHCRAHFGSYCLAYDETDPNETNTMADADRARQTICLGPTGNFQGTYKFLCLESGKGIKCK